MMQHQTTNQPLARSAASLALRRRFVALRPGLELSPKGYVAALEDNLLPGVERRQFAGDLARGDGRELASKLRAVDSSAALVVNSFARFKDRPADLTLAGLAGFQKLTFERGRPGAARGGRRPPVDLLAEGAGGVVAVEAKCTEPLRPTAPGFAAAYAERIRDERRAGAWFQALETVQAEPEAFALLDVAQLIKQALGLAGILKGRRTTLLYLYWEPLDAHRDALMLAHRREIERFTRLVAGGFPAFRAQSYRDLWAEWQMGPRPAWLKEHAGNLRARYDVCLGEAAPG
jgi:hypothetical protein